MKVHADWFFPSGSQMGFGYCVHCTSGRTDAETTTILPPISNFPRQTERGVSLVRVGAAMFTVRRSWELAALPKTPAPRRARHCGR